MYSNFPAEQQVRAKDRALQRVRLDIEEIKASSAAPRNELKAPLIKGRDFVSNRLALELQSAEQALVESEQAMAQRKKG